MKRLLLVLMLATFTACAGGVDTTVPCPDQGQSMSREQWQACYGYQDHDSGAGDGR